MNKKNELVENTIIHCVYDETIRNFISAHSHGYKDIVGYEFEIAIPLENRTILHTINSLAREIYEGKINIVYNEPIEVDFLNCKIMLIKCDFMNNCDLIRIVFPDANFKFPGEEGVSPQFEIQFTVDTLKAGLLG